MAINGQSAYEQFLQNGYWPDEESRQAGLQWAGANAQTPSSNITNLNPYAQYQTPSGMAPLSNAVDYGHSQGPTVVTPYNPYNDQGMTGSPGGTAPQYPVGYNLGLGGMGGAMGGTSSAPTATGGTSTAQNYYQPGLNSVGQEAYQGMPTPVYSGMPAPLGGDNPLANAVLQGYGMGLAPFNTQWYDNLGSSLFNQASKNYTENIAPAINSGAQLAGQYGGNRGEIAKGMALQGLNQNVMNALAPQYAQGYENWLNRGVGVGDSAMRGLLGIGGLDINAYNAQTAAAQAAAGAAGTPQYTSPWGSGIGTAITLGQLASLWGN